MKQIFTLTSTMLLASISSAFAHHPLGGVVPDSAINGLLSGIGHPVIGFDHLAFIIAIGVLAALQSHRLLMPAGFIGGTILGTVLSVSLMSLPFAEWVITLSVLAAGAVAMRGRKTAVLPATMLAALAGLFHGWAYGAAVIGAEMTPLMAYLAGFSLVQLAIVLTTGYVLRMICNVSSAEALRPRLAGAMIAGVGLSYFVELVEAAVFPAM